MTYTPEMNRARWTVLCELLKMLAAALWRNIQVRAQLFWLRWCVCPAWLVSLSIQVCIGAVRNWLLRSILAAVILWRDAKAFMRGW